MRIPKKASDPVPFLRRAWPFPSARAAFKSVLAPLVARAGGEVLLPSYIGWSPREGSGVFDPIIECGAPHAFYRMDARLRIDLEHLRGLLRGGDVGLLLLIHYFGYVDPGYEEAVRMARSAGVPILEDEAHALFSDLVGGACGRLGDACLFSLHKALPVAAGGLLMINAGRWPQPDPPPTPLPGLEFPWDFDLVALAKRRRENTAALLELLSPLGDEIDILRAELPNAIVPQTLPILLRRADRNRVYDQMNRAGFGVVSLYHTLIKAITPEDFPESHVLSRHILNLPVHQGADPAALAEMTSCLAKCLRQPASPDA